MDEIQYAVTERIQGKAVDGWRRMVTGNRNTDAYIQVLQVSKRGTLGNYPIETIFFTKKHFVIIHM
jgi:hypothetical protein